MRKIWLISTVVLVFLAVAACASVYTKSGERIYRVRGTAETYEPGKMISLAMRSEIEGFSDEGEVVTMTTSNPAEFRYAITPATDVKGTITPGVRVLIRYTQSGTGDNVAKTAVSVEKVWGK